MRIVFFEPTARRVHTKETNQEPISGGADIIRQRKTIADIVRAPKKKSEKKLG